ncbi:YbbR-like domain-containing protein [Roseivirga misakiensis]|uniref:YbbR-like domain-containing protein n=1 Tax=Roseivirga misakiensis TaxID=1563681 RepID=A0A1E5T4L6_9BACT|nr:hypothetical protein [Roseivirga misakiensis]OEK06322.1 hypothetical protein BFP71_01200 [Roseivirga misakiensis]
MRSAEDIIEKLKRSFQTPSRKDERFKVVVVCIVISTTFWFFSALNKSDYISQINYPVEIVFDDQNYIATSELPDRIPIEVTGGGWDLMTRSFGFNMNPIQIRLTDPDASNHILTSSLRGQLTPGLDPVIVNYILEDSLRFDIQKRASREFELILDPESINLDADFRLASSVTLNPSSVTWTGPERLINAMDRVIYVNAGLDNIDEDVIETVDIPETPEFFTSDTESVELSFEVVRLMDIEADLTVELINFPDSLWEVIPPSIKVRYRIEETKFDVADTLSIRLVADYQSLNPSDSSIQVQAISSQDYIEELRLSTQAVKGQKND